HNVFEMLSYASNIMTLRPGDVISMGSPAGVGTARETPIYMKQGDLAECTIESIGTLTNPWSDRTNRELQTSCGRQIRRKKVEDSGQDRPGTDGNLYFNAGS